MFLRNGRSCGFRQSAEKGPRPRAGSEEARMGRDPGGPSGREGGAENLGDSHLMAEVAEGGGD